MNIALTVAVVLQTIAPIAMPNQDQPPNRNAMHQTNRENAKGYVGGNRRVEAIAFQPYLESILRDEKYRQTWGFYTATDAVGKRREPQTAAGLDIGLMVQLLQPRQEAQTPRQQDEDAQAKEKTERLPVLDGIRKYAAEHVLLMGRPGSGKTTALLKLLADQAKQALADSSIPSPVLVELRYLDAERPSVLERIGAFLQSHALSVEEATLNTALAEGKLLLLIDGVNELPSEAARRAVARFRQDYPKTPMIFTTRDIAIGGDVGIEKKLEMQPLTESQMRQFVQAYLSEQGEPMLRQLQGRLREIGQTPLLLWMLCEVFRGLKQLPSSLGLLFRWFAGEYDKLKQDAPVSDGLRHWQSELLQHLAFTMMQAEQPTELRVAISRQKAESVFAAFLQGKEAYPEKRAKEWLEDLLEHHLLQHTGQNGLEFHHQLLQEYYAAEALLQRLPQFSDEQLKRDYLNYLKWTEPIALMLGLVSDEAIALDIVGQALDVDWRLGARLAGEVKPEFQVQTIQFIEALEVPDWLKIQLLGETRSYEVISTLLEALRTKDSIILAQSAKWLGSLGNSMAIESLKEQLKALGRNGSFTEKDIQAFLYIVEALCKLSPQEASKLRANFINRLGSYLSFRAMYTFPKLLLVQSELEDYLPELFGALENKESEQCRKNAALLLGQVESETIIPRLIKALDDPYLSVRRSVVKALGNFHHNKTVQGLIIQGLIKALQDPEYFVREDAIRALIKVKTKECIAALAELLEHPDFDVSWYAVVGLAQLYYKPVLPKVLEGLTNDRRDIRSSAARLLGYFNDEQSITRLSEALTDPDYSVRRNAAISLAKLGKEEAVPELLRALRNYYPPDEERVGVETIISGYNGIVLRGIHHQDIKRLGNEQALDQWLLETNNLGIRVEIVESLKKFCTEKSFAENVMTELIKNLKSAHLSIYWSTAILLGQLGRCEVIPALFEVLEYNDSSIKHQLELSLIKLVNDLGCEEIIIRLLEILRNNDLDSDVHWNAIDILVNCKDSLTAKYLPKLLALIQSKSGQADFWAIASIQDRCKYYNYEIFQGLIPQGKTISLYFSSAPSDVELQAQLANHLNLLERQAIITSWHHRQILPGDEPARVISDRLNTADIILLLISADAIADHTCYDIEINRAMERHQAGEARVIPILLRPVDWKNAPFSQLLVLPRNHQPVTSWSDRDAAFQEIAEGIREVAIELRREQGNRGTGDRPSKTNSVIYDLRGAAMPTAHAYAIANLAHEVHGNQITQPEELS